MAQLLSLAGCHTVWLHTLYFGGTDVSELGPLSACSMLVNLDCSGTCGSELGPLSACSHLMHLNCSGTVVSELDPLSACTQLRLLSCRAPPGYPT